MDYGNDEDGGRIRKVCETVEITGKWKTNLDSAREQLTIKRYTPSIHHLLYPIVCVAEKSESTIQSYQKSIQQDQPLVMHGLIETIRGKHDIER